MANARRAFGSASKRGRKTGRALSTSGRSVGKAVARRGRRDRAVIGGKLPTMDDFVKTVPKGGLLNPGLRKGVGKVPKNIS